MYDAAQHAAANAPRCRGGARPGFTLVELLVVIMIIGILLGIMLPTLNKIMLSVRVRRSEATINRVHGAVRMYHSEHKEYPASAWVLAEAIATSWQKRSRGQTYGPYYGADGLRRGNALASGQTGPNGETSLAMFYDDFDNPILYYLFRQDSADYDPNAISGLTCTVPTNLNAYLKGEGDQYYREDFVLITPGPDHGWEPLYTGGGYTDSDDLNNFGQE